MKIVIDIPQKVYDKALSGDGTGAVWAGYVKDGTPLTEWLNSFDTSSATKCFEAVNLLKMKIAQEEMHEADERLLNSDWGEMEVQE